MLWSQYSKPRYNKVVVFFKFSQLLRDKIAFIQRIIIVYKLVIFLHIFKKNVCLFFSFQSKSPFWLNKNHSCTMALMVTQHALQLQSNQSQSDLIQKDYKRGFRGIHS